MKYNEKMQIPIKDFLFFPIKTNENRMKIIITKICYHSVKVIFYYFIPSPVLFSASFSSEIYITTNSPERECRHVLWLSLWLLHWSQTGYSVVYSHHNSQSDFKWNSISLPIFCSWFRTKEITERFPQLFVKKKVFFNLKNS